ncbi:MAG: Sir2 family NAD+-dependent deacetylase [Pseudomonadota bacterium]
MQGLSAKGSIVVLTGAGISVESGLPSFRGADGLWQGFRLEEVATPEAFARQPDVVQRFYDERRRQLLADDIAPNKAHKALAELERHWAGNFLLVTQNIDDLHERAGSTSIIHMHGEILKARCLSCDAVVPWTDDLETAHACPSCEVVDRLRPHIVWFGEMPLDLDRIYKALEGVDLFLAIGTSGQVYPAAGFVQAVNEIGHACTIELNLEPSTIYQQFDMRRIGPATDTVPALVDELLQISS